MSNPGQIAGNSAQEIGVDRKVFTVEISVFVFRVTCIGALHIQVVDRRICILRGMRIAILGNERHCFCWRIGFTPGNHRNITYRRIAIRQRRKRDTKMLQGQGIRDDAFRCERVIPILVGVVRQRLSQAFLGLGGADIGFLRQA
ncbi:hypothetical protein ALO95_200374 [Pseudomonas syringae pv. antirrhini]|nr:hypothetical protein ALO95_200374 [Pseudomonas syringae pv. antirrhini]